MTHKTLITGGAGFLGSHIADKLLEQGDTVAIIDNLATGKKEHIPTHERLQFFAGSIANQNFVNEVFEHTKPTRVIHAAAAYKDPNNHAEDIATNVLGTSQVVDAAKRHACQQIVYLQTALCYGHTTTSPIPITQAIAPESSYAISKTAGEEYIQLSGLPYVSLRLANIYGPRHLSGPIPTFYLRLSQGQACYAVNTRRDFVEVSDFLSLIDLVLKNPQRTGCYHVSSGSDVGIPEILELTRQKLGLSQHEPLIIKEPQGEDVANLLLDPSETYKTYGWKTEVGLEQGMQKMIGWFQSHPIQETYTHLKH